ncbi:MAG: hypothetical protein KC917_16210, partial [Candidatus Omnitrophica bacterium]|nr:hypothetical protein [Candidatus Omnitrophota bacterium]
YSFGFSWWDKEGWGVSASVAAIVEHGTQTFLEKRTLPSFASHSELPEEWSFRVDPSLYQNGQLTFQVKNETGRHNAILSEIWLREATEDIFEESKCVRVQPTFDKRSRISESRADTVRLWAEDPVGKRIDPGETYLSEDSFYVDVATDDPFEALEIYGRALRRANGARPNPYQFPTVCGWYAWHPRYGDGPVSNTSLGMVKEAEAVAETGFLRYASAAIRLVPDDYGIDNEQGWWDDDHWRKYHHYVTPFDSSSSWASAVLKRGCIPLTYFQAGLISRDYAFAHPDHMLFNAKGRLDLPFDRKKSPVAYDYTDPDFQRHLKGVYDHLREAGILGLMFDYPHKAWANEGGFEDSHATTGSAYRKIYELAKSGLGPQSYIHERLLRTQNYEMPMTDLSVGFADSQRVWGDTDGVSMEMYSRCGLRWYKARTVFTYDTDAKNYDRLVPKNRDGLRQLLTMSYVTGFRLLLATSFEEMNPEQVLDLSRIYPQHQEPRSFRPLDAFSEDPRKHPEVYALDLGPAELCLVLLNSDVTREKELSIDLELPQVDGGLSLNPDKEYHVFDFWNDRYRGTRSGKTTLKQQLRPGEARVLSIRALESRPQILSTNRHLLQGALDLKKERWDSEKKVLEGVA